MIVLDASALLDVLLDQPTKPWILDRLTGAEVCAPAHQPAEVLSALARLVRADTLDDAAARLLTQELSTFHQELVPPSQQHLVTALALQPRLRVLDGLYVALAQDRAVPLVTTDLRLARAQLPITVLTPGAETPRS